MNAADLFIRCLEAEGVEYIFAVPGEENLRMLEALRTSTIKLIVTRHEQAAAFMAATIGRLTGKAGVAMSTLGPGALNFATALAYSQLGEMPLIIITGQKPIKHSKQGAFQVIDAVSTFTPLTKWATQLVSGQRIPTTIRNAFKIAEEERPGAVHIEFPEDIADEEVPSGTPIIPTKVRRPGPDEKAVNMAKTMIENSKKPLLIIAAGANRKLAGRRLTEFVEKTKIPFVTSQMGKGVIDERSPYYLGTTALSAQDYVHDAIIDADLIISVGHDTMEKPPAFLGDGQKNILHINFFPAQFDSIYAPTLELIGDIAFSMWALTETITPNTAWDLKKLMDHKLIIETALHNKDNNPEFPPKPQRIVSDLRKAVPEDGIIALDNGMYKLWVSRNYPAFGHNTVLLDNALATMGAGLPSAIAAKMVNPEKKVVCITGDGGFMMNSQELETAVRLGLDLTILLINDNAYGMIQWKQKSAHFSSFGLDLGNPDFVKYAEAYGAHGYRITKTEELVPLLEKCINTSGVHLIEVPIDYSENVRVFTEELSNRLT